MSEELTPEEQLELQKFMSANSPIPEEKYGHHKFLHDVSISPDTTKTGFLKDEEIGIPKNPIRTYKDTALDCSDIMVNDFFAKHFMGLSENVTATSLSRGAKLITLAGTQQRLVGDVTKQPKSSKGLFKKKEEKEDE